ncbi:MAG: MFS transporter [Puniceicoccaceae bacterium]|nr:MAG: MFS transporter [Puniceicoccaceae bacterium]
MNPAGAGGTPLANRPSLRPFRPGLVFGFFNAVTWQVALGTPMVLFAERLGAGPVEVGAAYSFVFLLAPVQVLSTTLFSRLGYRRLMLLAWGARSLFLLPPLALALLAPAEAPPWMLGLFLFSVFGFCLVRAMGNGAYLPWLYAILPPAARGRFLATDQVLSGISSVGTLLICAGLFALLQTFPALAVQYGMAFAGAWLGCLALFKLQDAPRPEGISLRRIVREGLPRCLRPSPFRRFLLASLLFGTAMSSLVPFAVYYLKVEADLSAGRIVFFTTVQFGGSIAGALMLRSLVDRTGPKPFFLLGMGAHLVVGLFWYGLVSGREGWMPVLPWMYVLLGAGAACWFAGTLNYLPQIVEERMRPLLVSLHGASASLVAGVSPVLWGIFLRPEPGERMNPDNFGLFLLYLCLVAVALGWIMLRTPMQRGEDHTPLALGAGLLRPFRGFSTLAGWQAGGTRPAGTEEKPRSKGSSSPCQPDRSGEG